ncbi:MAG: hypothetical protein U0791_23130 [Gemmataceae bacterium]
MMFPAGTRVRFFTVFGPRLGTVVEVLDDSIDGDHVHRVQPDDVAFGVMLLLGRSLSIPDGEPFIVEAVQ